MRTAFIKTLLDLAAEDDRIWLATGDLGYAVLEPFRDQFPDRFVNVGVAEQNMTGVAAGLASTGRVVFTYSIANFPTLRCFEQIRNDVCYHNLPVKIVSVGAGFTYGPHGYTHHGLEDVGTMRTLPGMTIVAPGDPFETQLAVRALVQQPGPCYLRLGKAGEPEVHRSPPPFTIGRAITVRDGNDVTIITAGGLLEHSVETADRLLAESGINARVLSMHTIKPLDIDAVAKAARETGGIVTIEEHSIVGGLGSAIAEVVASLEQPYGFFQSLAAPDELHHRIGSASYMREMIGDLFHTVLHAVESRI